MRAPRHKRSTGRSAWLAGWLLTAAVYAASPERPLVLVDYREESSPIGLFPTSETQQETGTEITTRNAPATSGSYRFTHWEINGIRNDDFLDTALNPARFVITEPTVSRAMYIPAAQDSDSDGLPDWWELHNYTNLAQTADSDTDHDGLSLLEEYRQSTKPTLVNLRESGAVGSRLSAVKNVILNTNFAAYTERSYPIGLFSTITGIYSNGTELVTRTAPLTVSSSTFCYWEVNGIRQETAFGSAPEQIALVIDGTTTATAHYLPTSQDANTNGVPDWYELRFVGELVDDNTADMDGDGLGLLAEYRQSTHPGIENRRTAGIVASRISDVSFRIRDPNDIDSDLIPDQWELDYFGTRYYNGASDTDGDGISLLWEYRADYSPLLRNRVETGAVASRMSAVITANLAYWPQFIVRSEPTGLITSQSGIRTPGTVISTPRLNGSTSGYRFSYWSLNGIRQADVTGTSVRGLDFTLWTDSEAVAHYLPESRDDDADGLPDWWEYFYFGTAGIAAGSDSDGDGYTALEEYRASLNPRIANLREPGVVSGRMSDVLLADLQIYPRETEILLEGSFTTFFDGEFYPGSFSMPGNTAPALGDFDGDKDRDLFVAASNGLMRVFRNDGSRALINFTEITNLTSLADMWETIPNPVPALGDWNNDRYADLAIGGDAGGEIHLRLSGGQFEDNPYATTVMQVSGTVTTIPAFAEINGDGLIDLLVGTDSGLVRAYTNTGSATMPFSEPAAIDDLLGMPVPGITGLDAADVTGDPNAFPDILASDAVGRIWQFDRGNSPTDFSLNNRVFAGTYPGFAERLCAAVQDMDGDGRADVIAGSADGGLIYLRSSFNRVTVAPPGVTLLTGETYTFEVVDPKSPISWGLRENASGGFIDSGTGFYTAGTTGGVDVVQGRDGRDAGVSYVNVLDTNIVNRIGRALIVAGGKSLSDPVWFATDHVADFAYQVLLYRGFLKSAVRYLSFDPDQDADGNGQKDDIYGYTSYTNVAHSFTNWASEANQLLVMLADHGSDNSGEGFFRLNSTEVLRAADLRNWLDTLQFSNTNLDVTVVMDFCYAGSFLDEVANTNLPPSAERILLAATSPDELTYFIAGGLISFSDIFFAAVLQGFDLLTAFELAQSAMSVYQNAQMDDDGDGVYTGEDGLAAQEVVPGPSYIVGRDIPTIGQVTPNMIITNDSVEVWAANINSVHPLDRVWCTVLSPSHNPNSETGIPVVDVAQIDMQLNRDKGRYEAELNGFSEAGVYQVAYNAADIWGGLSFPKRTFITQLGIDDRFVLLAAGDTNETDWASTRAVAGTAFNTAKARLFADDKIHVLAEGPMDLDGDGSNDVDTPAGLADISHTFTNALAPADRVIFFAAGTGISNALQVTASEELDAATLKDHLDTFQAADRDAVVILDFSGAGSWLPELASPQSRERINLAATGSDRQAMRGGGGLVSYSQFFFSDVFQGSTIGDASTTARRTIRRASGRLRQRAEIDDDGDGLSNEKNVDGTLSRTRYIGPAFLTGDDIPFIASVIPDTLTATNSLVLWAADVLDVNGISNVWCVVTPPDYDGSSLLDEVSLDYNAASMRYEGLYEGFIQTGLYILTFYASDVEGDLSAAVQTSVTRAADPYSVPDAFEIDNTQAEASEYLRSQFHTFHEENDEDWVRIFLVSNFVYDIETRHHGTNVDTVVEIWQEAPNGSLSPVDTVDDFGFEEGELTGLDFPPTGFYVLRVSPYPGQSFIPGAYTLSIDIPSGNGSYMVFAVPVDQSPLPGGASLQVDGGSSNAFNGESYVSFQLSPGAHQVALTLPEGYRTQESPVVAGQVQNPDSAYGNPRNIVSDDISIGISGFTTFKLFPLITVEGSIRNRWNGLPVSGARITATALSGPLAGLSFDQWPYEANYASAWETDTDGEFPAELLLIAGQDYQLNIVYSNYTSVITNIYVAGIPPGGIFDSGLHWQTPLDSNVNGIEDAWEYENFGSLIRSTADVDRDGHDNETEFRLGTDPNSPDSVLAFDTLDVPGEDGSIMLYWPVAANRSYEVSALTNLVSDNWVRVFGPWTAPSNGIVWWADTNAVDKATRTYRIGVILP